MSKSEPDNLVGLFENAIQRFSDKPLFGAKGKDGVYRWVTYREVGERVNNLRGGLAGLGVGKGDTVGIIANNRTEWAVIASATYGLGARLVPMYEAELVNVWKYIIEDSSVKVLLVSKPEVLQKVSGFPTEIATLEKIVVIEGDGEGSMASLEKAGSKSPVPSVHPDPDDIAMLIYTSGTTGSPKGVLLSHGNLTSNVLAGYRCFPMLGIDDRSLSILPWAHSFGQTAELNCFLYFGGSIGFMESVDTLAEDMVKVRPTYLIAVPRIFNKVYDALWTKMNEEGGLPRKLFMAAVEAARKKRELSKQGRSSAVNDLKLKVLDKVVFKKIRARFGGRLKAAITGSATMNEDIANFFWDIGVPVFDCYGLTETSPAVTINCFAAHKLGTVGKPVQDVKVVIDKSVVEESAPDGEVVVYGPNVMKGYYNKPEETAKVMTEDGGFRTGDRGRLDENGYLCITGRIKEQYKLENGKYVFPASIEEDIKLIPYVTNALVYGDGRNYNVCLVVPDFDVLGKYAAENGLPIDPTSLVQSEDVKNLIRREITNSLKGRYGGYEIPRKVRLLEEDFTLENGMLTQTMKLRRAVILERYQDAIGSLYE